MLKRIADMLEKFTVASLAIGLYKEGDAAAVAGGVVFCIVCLALTKWEAKQ
jgi:hypothetical protein